MSCKIILQFYYKKLNVYSVHERKKNTGRRLSSYENITNRFALVQTQDNLIT